MRRAFTLMEIMVVVAIIAVVATTAFLGIGSGGAAARLRGATRAVFATVRQARSVALVTQKPAVVTYSNSIVDGEPCISVSIESVRLMDTSVSGTAYTLSGDEVDLSDPTGEIAAMRAKAAEEGGDDSGETAAGGAEAGESIEEIIFAPVDRSVMGGMVVKVSVDGEDDDGGGDDRKVSVVSAFSNVDMLLGRYKNASSRGTGAGDGAGGTGAAEAAGVADAAETGGAGPADGVASADDLPPEVKVAWEPNGRCTPHRIWVYRAGRTPDKGLCIEVDRFGSARVLGIDGEEVR